MVVKFSMCKEIYHTSVSRKKRYFFKAYVYKIYYHYGWYFPLFLLLLGVKICLLSLIADSIRHHRTSLSENHSRIKKTAHEARSASQYNSMTTDSPENVVSPIPENLMDLDIIPSGKNRTSSTSIWLIYNSVPKCGDEYASELLQDLANKNGFSHQDHEYQTPWPRFLLEQEQESLVQWFQYQHLRKSYNRHFFFVNFTRFQKYSKQKPIYFNIVRDPVDRLVLDYYDRRNKSSSATQQEVNRRNSLRSGAGTEWYHRTFEECVLQADPECRYTAGEKSFTLMIPFFCGQHNSCVVINDRRAIQMAKFNIESEYSVVGVLEKMDQTLGALEKFVPTFFSGAVQLYNELGRNMKTRESKHYTVSSYVRQIVENELYNEVELYQFISRRLAIQQQVISRRKGI